MRYKKLKLYKIADVNTIEAVCASGDSAGVAASCVSGPEANGGCESGVAAANSCVSGAAAGTRCDQGAGFESDKPAN